jgi:hypothetical protein
MLLAVGGPVLPPPGRGQLNRGRGAALITLVESLSDRLLSLIVPRTTASACPCGDSWCSDYWCWGNTYQQYWTNCNCEVVRWGCACHK